MRTFLTADTPASLRKQIHQLVQRLAAKAHVSEKTYLREHPIHVRYNGPAQSPYDRYLVVVDWEEEAEEAEFE